MRRTVDVPLGEAPPITLTLPPLFEARLRVLLPAGVDPSTLAVQVAWCDPETLLVRTDSEPFPLDAEGRRTIPGLVEGEYALHLVAAPVAAPQEGGARRRRDRDATGARLDLGGFALGRALWLEPGEDPATFYHTFDVRQRLPKDLRAPEPR